MFNKRATIGMSVETIVVVIISLVVLTGGITLMYNWIYGAESIKGQLDERTNTELDRLLVDQGKQVALPRNVGDVSRGEGHIFGVGVLNIGAQNVFHITVDFVEGKDEAGNAITEVDLPSWVLYNDQSFTLDEGQNVKELISLQVPKNVPLGQYIFDVRIWSGTISEEKVYGNPQKIIINVKQ
ncbi:MAG: hypothetical protein WCV90_00050 [Candidatus Woesearchaeota archaeon]|jgi:hypothetical protein